MFEDRVIIGNVLVLVGLGGTATATASSSSPIMAASAAVKAAEILTAWGGGSVTTTE